MLRLWEVNNFTRGPILLVEASSRRLCGEWDYYGLGEGAEQPFTVGSPVSQLLEALNKLLWRANILLIDSGDSRVEFHPPDERVGILGKAFLIRIRIY